LQVMEEIVPLCVLGRIVGGPYEGMYVVTKGGAVGDRTAIVKSVRSLLSRTTEKNKIGRNQS
jgi:D-threonate/D-erythronate kinase